ncbi:hypothetical protein ACFP65_09980 [Marinilactibacillus sp. GCM10026970]|uniref:hypothetical protein n=1 Tax=Marinilactibacillus sp. GCM10026970 TaxID=3252642 RepID=UPI00360F68DC
MEIKCTIYNQNGTIKFGKNDYEEKNFLLTETAVDFVYLSSQQINFNEGDYFEIEISERHQYLVVQLDPSLAPSLVYIPDKKWRYDLRLGKNWREATHESVFNVKRTYSFIRIAKEYEVNQYQNLSMNTHDLNHFAGAYPHASANVETRNDATFFAMNAIDGVYANNSHGSFPYQSWGVNQQDDAELKIDFGRTVFVNEVELTLRADFPHDNYWTQGVLVFSDGTEKELSLTKTNEIQLFNIDSVKTKWVVLKCLLKDPALPSPFPALTQISVYGKNCLNFE